MPLNLNFYEDWQEVPDNQVFDNGFKVGFKVQWPQFLRYVFEDALWCYDFLEAAKGQLVDSAYCSAAERRWIDLDRLEL